MSTAKRREPECKRSTEERAEVFSTDTVSWKRRVWAQTTQGVPSAVAEATNIVRTLTKSAKLQMKGLDGIRANRHEGYEENDTRREDNLVENAENREALVKPQ